MRVYACRCYLLLYIRKDQTIYGASGSVLASEQKDGQLPSQSDYVYIREIKGI